MKVYIGIILATLLAVFNSCNCEIQTVTQEEFVGTYVMKCGMYIDTLIIKPDGVCYHSSTMTDDKISNISQNGTWRETVSGYFEVTLIRESKGERSMDIKPEKCKGTGKITIPVTINDFCFYKKVQ